MKSHLTDDFLVCFAKLPDRIKRLARENYKLWSKNPYHPSLSFKKIGKIRTISYYIRLRLIKDKIIKITRCYMKSDKLICLSIEKLFAWVFEGKKNGEIFGIPEELFFNPKKDDPFKINRYGQELETPVGVASGPHTQMSQNIISSWLTGARYIELKTVQILDEIDVTKPCIDMKHEGYNCEWSQELKLDESFNEYLNAWIMIHILKDSFGWNRAGEAGFIFNMSVGYNMEGIMSKTVQRFLDRMTNCPYEKNEKIEKLGKIYPKIKEIDIPDKMTDNITISTMHGCPPDEIEKIARYFIEERKLDTTIKLNPTLLGPDRLRDILNKRLGFDVVVPDEAFGHDLKYDDGLKLIKTLLESARKNGVTFNLKLTNTLESLNTKLDLPENEKMLYMSGRPLHPISINLAAILQKEFNGELDISFAAGVDFFNITEVLKCGLTPVTVCSDVLKPGGYGRITGYLENIEKSFDNAKSIKEYIIKSSKKDDLNQAIIYNLEKYAQKVLTEPYYKKDKFFYDSVKTERKLEFFDCAKAPCMSACPAGQEIPRYIDYAAKGEIEKAYKTILATNPFPNVQGRVCDHMCQTKCARINYDEPLKIRDIKKYIADNADDFNFTNFVRASSNGLKVSIIGGGPSGLSCAYFLALEGFEVEIFEAKGFLGGMAADAIPLFRLDEKFLKKDIDRILSLGVKIKIDFKVNSQLFENIREKSNYIYIAVGAQKSMPLSISGIDSKGVYDQLSFLGKVRRCEKVEIGDDVIVIGGGNSAIDAARAAKRIVGDNGKVTILYRRTKNEMPCDQDELIEALDEGIELIELAAPEEVISENGTVKELKASKMKLGELDKSGRRKPIKIKNSEFVIKTDTIITAIGQKVILDFYPEKELKFNPKTYETGLENVFAGGDAARGASSLINAIGDGKAVAFNILEKAGKTPQINISPKDDRMPDYDPDYKGLQIKQTKRFSAIKLEDSASVAAEAARCLQCDLMCNVCTTVCPNRANIYYKTEPLSLPVEIAVKQGENIEIKLKEIKNIKQKFQIINIGDFCNECGNCATFCPSSGAPYKDKPKFHITKESFDNAEFGFYFADESHMIIKDKNGISNLKKQGDDLVYESPDVSVILDSNTLKAKKVLFKSQIDKMDISSIAEYAFLYNNIKNNKLFK
jgi:putative selenate reductase